MPHLHEDMLASLQGCQGVGHRISSSCIQPHSAWQQSIYQPLNILLHSMWTWARTVTSEF